MGRSYKAGILAFCIFYKCCLCVEDCPGTGGPYSTAVGEAVISFYCPDPSVISRIFSCHCGHMYRSRCRHGSLLWFSRKIEDRRFGVECKTFPHVDGTQVGSPCAESSSRTSPIRYCRCPPQWVMNYIAGVRKNGYDRRYDPECSRIGTNYTILYRACKTLGWTQSDNNWDFEISLGYVLVDMTTRFNAHDVDRMFQFKMCPFCVNARWSEWVGWTQCEPEYCSDDVPSKQTNVRICVVGQAQPFYDDPACQYCPGSSGLVRSCKCKPRGSNSTLGASNNIDAEHEDSFPLFTTVQPKPYPNDLQEIQVDTLDTGPVLVSGQNCQDTDGRGFVVVIALVGLGVVTLLVGIIATAVIVCRRKRENYQYPLAACDPPRETVTGEDQDQLGTRE